MGRRSFGYTVYAHRETFVARAYEPFEGAPFIAQRDRFDQEWLVVHRNSSMIVWHAAREPLRAALEIASHMSVHCPEAARVKLKRDERGNPLAGHLSGPHRKVREAIRAMLPVPA